MAIKFIDGIDLKDDLYDDEVIVRCACGCSFVCIRTYDYSDGMTKHFPALEIGNYGQSPETNASNLDFILPNDITIILNLLSKYLNDGNGALMDVEGKVLSFNRIPQQSEMEETLCVMAFENQKKFKSFMKNPERGEKFVSWNVLISGKNLEKFCTACQKIISKKFKNFINQEEVVINDEASTNN